MYKEATEILNGKCFAPCKKLLNDFSDTLSKPRDEPFSDNEEYMKFTECYFLLKK